MNEKHPYRVIASILGNRTDELSFEFSRYIYKPKTTEDVRREFTAHGATLDPELVRSWIDTLERDEELAINSRVSLSNGEKRHIPMIDFVCKTIDVQIYQRVNETLPKSITDSMLIFDSGTSFHAYSYELIDESAWFDFLGYLLLIDGHGLPRTIDTRWIGHRLIGRYASLRWTNNSGRHFIEPVYVGEFPSLRNALPLVCATGGA
ncbi:MAG: hypothetical protein IPJ30_12575 [Acidobacteria bacterium]|nr:hypothetical protein [Acidobacteriota bacterium]